MIAFFSPPRYLGRLQRRAHQSILLALLAVLAACASNEEPYDAVQDLQKAYEQYQDQGFVILDECLSEVSGG
jgi:glutathione peroxidase-family protein